MLLPLEESLASIRDAAVVGRNIWIGLDFDGTLVPIQDRPEQVTLDADSRFILQGLASAKGVSLAVISGRSVADVKAKVGLTTIAYSGNHGLEIQLPMKSYTHPRAAELAGTLNVLAES